MHLNSSYSLRLIAFTTMYKEKKLNTKEPKTTSTCINSDLVLIVTKKNKNKLKAADCLNEIISITSFEDENVLRNALQKHYL